MKGHFKNGTNLIIHSFLIANIFEESTKTKEIEKSL